MIEIDYALLALAIISMTVRPAKETLKLLIFFSVSVGFVNIMEYYKLFESLVELWLVIYTGWIVIFAMCTTNKRIVYLYCAQMLSCLTMLLSWHFGIFTKLVYNLYIFMISVLYTMQILEAYGSSLGGSYNKLLNRFINLAPVDVKKWR